MWPVPCSHRSTAGSLRVLTLPTCRRPKHCWRGRRCWDRSAGGIRVIGHLFAVEVARKLDLKAEFFQDAYRGDVLDKGHGCALAKLILLHPVGQDSLRHLRAKTMTPKLLGEAIPKINVTLPEAKSAPARQGAGGFRCN